MRQQRRLKVWLPRSCGYYLPVIISLCLIAHCHAQGRGIDSDTDWRAVNARLAKLYRASEYEQVAQTGQTLGARLLAPEAHQYAATAFVALSLNKLDRTEAALPYFEKALSVNFKESLLYSYFAALFSLNETSRSVDFLQHLGNTFPAQQEFLRPYIMFFAALDKGDAAYLNGDKATALTFYQQAISAYQKIPLTAEEQATYREAVQRKWDEYTYYRLYDVPDGYKRDKLLDAAFLKPKIQMCQATVPDDNPVIYKMAALIVRNVDVQYEDHGKPQAQKSYLDETKLKLYRQSWQFAMDAVQFYSKGKFKVETTWIDLPNVTLTGLDDEIWHGLIHVRWLDPKKLVPSQDALLQKVATQYDGIAFVWDRGKAASAYGSGPRPLPLQTGQLPVRGLIKSMPPEAVNCLHEFLHNMGGATGITPHGIHGDWDTKVFPQYKAHNLTDQVDWYTYLITAAKDWQRVKFLTAGATAPSTPEGETGGD